MSDYRIGDAYREFARAALGITAVSKRQRQVYKGCVLGRIYGMGARTLARNLGISHDQARNILQTMADRYPVKDRKNRANSRRDAGNYSTGFTRSARF
jgi:DNA polymerase I-like protein with 3'-5' exonuclease and polymerase domains